jgi:hypothetical protein
MTLGDMTGTIALAKTVAKEQNVPMDTGEQPQ